MKYRRRRLIYTAILALVIIAGLSSRSSLAVYMPSFIAEYAGDTLWTLAVFLTFTLIFPASHTLLAGVFAILVSFGVEASQLYQADWLNALRDTIPGKLILGSGFKWSDFICYTTGACLGIAGEYLAIILRARGIQRGSPVSS